MCHHVVALHEYSCGNGTIGAQDERVFAVGVIVSATATFGVPEAFV